MIGELVRRMSEAGATPTALAVAVEAIELARAEAAAQDEARRAAKRPGNAERQRRWRDKHKWIAIVPGGRA